MKSAPIKPLLLGLAIAAVTAACATTTSPTGRTQQVGAVPQEQLNQMGAQAFDDYNGSLPLTNKYTNTDNKLP